MPGLKLYISNRLEELVGLLSQQLTSASLSPFEKEIIVIQSRGMQRWISLELARRSGICANIDFPFPNHFLSSLFEIVYASAGEPVFFDREIMAWKLIETLPELFRNDIYAELRAYCGDDSGEAKLFMLADRIADVFDQYGIFRPEIISAWEKGEKTAPGFDTWQPGLWNEIFKNHPGKHRGAHQERILNKLRSGTVPEDKLPSRLMIFGISYLPAFHLSVFFELSRYIDVHFFVTNPCAYLWDYIRSGKEIRSIVRKGGERNDTLYVEEGNSLLASLGRQGRDFFSLLHKADLDEETFEAFVDPGQNSMLHCIQSDILNLREQKGPKSPPVKADDRSIQVHSCHSPMREVEVLYDNLLALFEGDPTLAPGDILVMTPDIEAYSPYVQAVFDLPESDRAAIPYDLADRAPAKQSEIIQAFFKLLSLPSSRFTASEIMGLLENAAVRLRFDIDDTELDTLRHWLHATNIRWGLDREFRKEKGFPESPHNTWEHGLDRILMGYAVRSENDRCVHGILPCDGIEGGNARLAGKLGKVIDTLAVYARKLAVPVALDRWNALLTGLIGDFFVDNEQNQRDLQLLRDGIASLLSTGKEASFESEVGNDIVALALEQQCMKRSSSSGFLSGKVCFAELLPMRSIPFKVICLLGMNYSSYPRSDHQPAFNLIRNELRPGDRSRREDDRYLFLETLLSARDILYISYTGKNLQDNTEIPPSVLVSELLDYIAGTVAPSDHHETILNKVITEHPLQAFSPRYFMPSPNVLGLFSYSKVNAAASSALHIPEPVAPFVASPLPDHEFDTISVDELCSFFGNPARYFLSRRLGIHLNERFATLDDNEPFALNALQNYTLAGMLLEKKIAGTDTARSFEWIRETGLLPHGTPGEYAFAGVEKKVNRLYSALTGQLSFDNLGELEIDLPVGTVRLNGKVPVVNRATTIGFRPAHLKPSDHISVWISLLACSEQQPGTEWKGMVFGSDKACAYAAPKKASAYLSELIDLYREGMKAPLKFIPSCSWKYAQAIFKGMSHAEALAQTKDEWFGNQYTNSESDDPSYRLCFRDAEPFDTDFFRASKTVLDPLFSSQQKI
ncbi:MAG: exodeoxyribonuclease V subunit gamma [Chitinivibrionales bacterium]|nr:exodeoxyribonuclease V subunit gamma [Chitinivibrionales bacterium]